MVYWIFLSNDKISATPGNKLNEFYKKGAKNSLPGNLC